MIKRQLPLRWKRYRSNKLSVGGALDGEMICWGSANFQGKKAHEWYRYGQLVKDIVRGVRGFRARMIAMLG